MLISCPVGFGPQEWKLWRLRTRQFKTSRQSLAEWLRELILRNGSIPFYFISRRSEESSLRNPRF